MEDLAQVDYRLARETWEARHIFLILRGWSERLGTA
jgi:hypothetical protein